MIKQEALDKAPAAKAKEKKLKPKLGKVYEYVKGPSFPARHGRISNVVTR